MENDLTYAEHKRYAELLKFFNECDEPGKYFDLQQEFMMLWDKAKLLGMCVDHLPF